MFTIICHQIHRRDPEHLKGFELWQKVWPRWRRNACLVANIFEGPTPSFEAIITFYFGTVEFHAKEARGTNESKHQNLLAQHERRLQDADEYRGCLPGH
jgi:hypothetical protein